MCCDEVGREGRDVSHPCRGDCGDRRRVGHQSLAPGVARYAGDAMPASVIALGIDVGASVVHCVGIDGEGRPVVCEALGLATLDHFLWRLPRGLVVAVDAPDRLSTGPHRDDLSLSRKFRPARCGEIALGRQEGYWVAWVTPLPGEPVPGWMDTGFEVHRRAITAGLRPIEVYPHAAFRRLNGGTNPRRRRRPPASGHGPTCSGMPASSSRPSSCEATTVWTRRRRRWWRGTPYAGPPGRSSADTTGRRSGFVPRHRPRADPGDAPGGPAQRPRTSSMRVSCATDSGPWRSAPTFSSTCSTVLKPGMGMVTGLRAQSQASAPWARVLPSRRGSPAERRASPATAPARCRQGRTCRPSRARWPAPSSRRRADGTRTSTCRSGIPTPAGFG